MAKIMPIQSGWRGQTYNDYPRTEHQMSQAGWCNINDPETNATFQIGHSFSMGDEDKEHFTKTRSVSIPTGNSYGRATYQEREEITETLDMCGYHARKQAGLFDQTPAITATVEDIEAAEADAADANAEMWKARYEAEKARRLNDI